MMLDKTTRLRLLLWMFFMMKFPLPIKAWTLTQASAGYYRFQFAYLALWTPKDPVGSIAAPEDVG